MSHRVAVLAGDGVGPEVVAEARKVVDALPGLGDDLRPYAVPGEDGDAMAQAGAPTRPGTPAR